MVYTIFMRTVIDLYTEIRSCLPAKNQRFDEWNYDFQPKQYICTLVDTSNNTRIKVYNTRLRIDKDKSYVLTIMGETEAFNGSISFDEGHSKLDHFKVLEVDPILKILYGKV